MTNPNGEKIHIMMIGNLLLRGIILGLSIAAPVGPIGVLCIRRTLADGKLAGLLSGLGAATADAVYGSIAGFGLTYLSSFLVRQQAWLHVIGGFFLCYLGIRTVVTLPEETLEKMDNHGWLNAYGSSFLLTLTNPLTILSFTTLFAGMGLGAAAGDYSTAFQLILGVFLGSVIWWLTLSTIVGLFHARFNSRSLVWVNRLSGIIITTFGISTFVAIFK
ncbi:MAG: LysE family transporter [Anaerolineae bacterium]|nr:LysE family transporter [Anaerolineae bacterium]